MHHILPANAVLRRLSHNLPAHLDGVAVRHRHFVWETRHHRAVTNRARAYRAVIGFCFAVVAFSQFNSFELLLGWPVFLLVLLEELVRSRLNERKRTGVGLVRL